MKSGEIHISVNGENLSIPEGSTLGQVLRIAEAPYREGASVGIVRRQEGVKASRVKEYLLKTTNGDFRIELTDFESPSAFRWQENYKKYEGIPFRWGSRDVLAFGPFAEDLPPSRDEIKAGRMEVFFGAGGFDPSNYHLIFSLNTHRAAYGTPAEGAFARVIAGKQVLSRLKSGNSIVSIEPVVEWEEEGEHFLTSDMDTVMEEGYSIFTYVGVEMNPEAPEGADHFFALIEDGFFHVDAASSSFISDGRLLGEACSYENFESREAGTVWVRTVGYGTGKFFISRDDRTASIMHSVVGNVVAGTDLVKIAEAGHKLFVTTNPAPLKLLGIGFEEAGRRLANRGVDLMPAGDTGDDALIVSLEPATTLEILSSGKVIATGVRESGVIAVELYDDLAPKTLDFFRHAAGMTFRPVGLLNVMMKYENTFLFRAEIEAEKFKEIFPENTPQEKAKALEIGVTNQAAGRAGLIGVKTVDDDLFGPTGEKFASTNIIGRILEPGKLEGLKEGNIMYILERED
jgi:putative methanogenesis marker protein 3